MQVFVGRGQVKRGHMHDEHIVGSLGTLRRSLRAEPTEFFSRGHDTAWFLYVLSTLLNIGTKTLQFNGIMKDNYVSYSLP
jgi:hypothetical protein